MKTKAALSGKTTEQKVLCSWSGGKDSCFALLKAKDQGYHPAVLLNVLNEQGRISRSHGIPRGILEAQARAMDLPIKMIESTWDDYRQKFTGALVELKSAYDLQAAVFGDIDLQPHRDWEEMVCAEAGLQAILPLWGQDREALVIQMLEAGFRAMIVSCNDTMGETYLGRVIDHELISELKSIGVDPCGENGEFHTLVIDCPLFLQPLQAEIRSKMKHEQYWFAEPVLLT